MLNNGMKIKEITKLTNINKEKIKEIKSKV